MEIFKVMSSFSYVIIGKTYLMKNNVSFVRNVVLAKHTIENSTFFQCHKN